MEHRLMSFVGLLVMISLAWLLSSDRRAFPFRIVLTGLALQFCMACIILNTDVGRSLFVYAQSGIAKIIDLSDHGAIFLFGENFSEHFFAFKVLPTIIFISSLSYILFYWGVIQKIIGGLAWIMKKAMNISGAEGLVTAANVFCGQTEAPLFVKPYIKTMTKSEINTMMTGGMATVSGGVLAAYVGLGISAGHLVAASLMSAPAAIFISKIIFPEKEVSVTHGKVSMDFSFGDANVFDAACNGATQGLQLALNVAAMLLTFIALIALINLGLSEVGSWFGFASWSLENLLSYLFCPLAYVMGVPWEDAMIVGRLLGERMVVNEFLAYTHLAEFIREGAISERSVNIATYALCGFANFSSIALQIGGIGVLEPSRKKDFAERGLKAMLGGTLATLMTACMAGILV